jgi:signal transduction histidine kinase/ABC-type amino acid transport substrate-binding protein
LRCLALCCLLLCATIRLNAELKEKYTAERPLIVVANHDFFPYEFKNVHMEPDGYHIEVLRELLKRIGLPYRIVMKEAYQICYSFEQQEADLTIEVASTHHKVSFYTSRCILDYYKLKVASPKGTPDINSVEQLKKTIGLVVNKNDLPAQELLDKLMPDTVVEQVYPRKVLWDIAQGSNKHLIWGEIPLMKEIEEMEMEKDIIINSVSLLAGEFHFIAHDQELIDQLDDHFARMDQSGQVKKLRDKWFHPERLSGSRTIFVLFITFIVIIFVITLIYLGNKLRQHEDKASRNAKELQHMMELALMESDYSFVLHDIEADLLTNSYDSELLPEEGINFEEFLTHIHPEDRTKMRDEIEELKKGKTTVCELKGRWKPFIEGANKDDEPWQYVIGHLLAEKDTNGQTRYIVGAIKDLTKEHKEEQDAKELSNRFFKLFDSTLVAMSFYDKNGKLIDLNANMRKLSGYDKEGENDFFHTTRLFDAPMFKGDFLPNSLHHLDACQHMLYPESDIDKYIEFQLSPIYENKKLLHYSVMARDITDERAMYMELYKKDTELRLTNEKRNKYEKELHYLLENSDMWVWNSDVAAKRINFTRTLHENQFTQSFDEFLCNLYEDQMPLAMDTFANMKGTESTINVILHFKKTPASETPQWIAISGIPLAGKDGHPIGHFGILRDVTNLMDAQEKLRQETIRAENSGKLKSLFLANMTHEIRTPLNAIVGFSDLLPIIDNPDERREFMRIIRNNCDMLVRLIDDIIEVSNINQGPLSIEAADVDFAVAFNDICQTLAQRVQEPGVEFLVDNPYKSYPTYLDKGRLQQVITNFTTNAVKYTHQGHIKVGYRSEENIRSDNGKKSMGIYMYCEDTGAGIPKDKQSTIFERFVKLNDFVQGTGLGLSICKSIADRCGGRIGVDSEGENCGSTFWIWFPCQLKGPSKV